MERDIQVLRELGNHYAQIAALPLQQEKKKLWTANNDLKINRPMVYIDQLPWHELAQSPEMRLECQDPFLRTVEQRLRETLYRFRHFPCDMVVEARVDIPKAYSGMRMGINVEARGVWVDAQNDVYSHEYVSQLNGPEDLEKLQPDRIVADRQLDAERLHLCERIFEGIMPVRLRGMQVQANVWDHMAQLMNQEEMLMDLLDRPEFIVQVVTRMRDILMDSIRQLENLDLLDSELEYVHCTGAYTNDLPRSLDGKTRARNVWGYGMSQIFGAVSKQMHEEFDIDLLRPMYEMFGLFYYGCCEPLHHKVDIIRKIKNVRKISMSPWADARAGAEAIAGDYVLSLKAHPALIASGRFEEEKIREQLTTAKQACERYGTPCEFILKDVSTVQGKLEFLDRWNQVAMEVALS